MQPDTRLGTFADVQAAGHAEILAAIRALVEARAPEAVEVASAREKSVWWGLGPKKMSDGFAWAMPHKAHVNLGFFEGASLPDPAGLLEGTGKALRHVKLRDPGEVDRPEIAALLGEAIARKAAR